MLALKVPPELMVRPDIFAAISSVTVVLAAIVTALPEVGILFPNHVPGVFQLPPLPVEIKPTFAILLELAALEPFVG